MAKVVKISNTTGRRSQLAACACGAVLLTTLLSLLHSSFGVSWGLTLTKLGSSFPTITTTTESLGVFYDFYPLACKGEAPASDTLTGSSWIIPGPADTQALGRFSFTGCCRCLHTFKSKTIPVDCLCVTLSSFNVDMQGPLCIVGCFSRP